MINKHMKRYSTQYVIWELQIKSIVRYRYVFFKIAKIQKLTISNTGEDAEKQGSSFIASGNAKWCHFGRQFGSFLQR